MNNIPEGATRKSKYSDGYFYKKTNGIWFTYDQLTWAESPLQKNDWFDENTTPIKQDEEMIYTKQMQEAGELPKVGMKVDFRKCDCEVMTGADAVG